MIGFDDVLMITLVGSCINSITPQGVGWQVAGHPSKFDWLVLIDERLPDSMEPHSSSHRGNWILS